MRNRKAKLRRRKFIANIILVIFYISLTATLLTFGIKHIISKAATSSSDSEATSWYEDLKEPIVVDLPKATEEPDPKQEEIDFLKGKLTTANGKVRELEEKVKKMEEAQKKLKEEQKKKKEEAKKSGVNNISAEEISMLEHLCYGEAGDQNDECQQAVVSVVLNRVKHKSFPNTIEGVIFQRRQYACTWDGNYDQEPSNQAKRNVQAVISGNGIYVPESVVFQAQFTQGSGVWRQIGTEIFCYEER